ncbi:hypothetical protein V6Z11_D13G049000 [Gossypium hirsutum]
MTIKVLACNNLAIESGIFILKLKVANWACVLMFHMKSSYYLFVV